MDFNSLRLEFQELKNARVAEERAFEEKQRTLKEKERVFEEMLNTATQQTVHNAEGTTSSDDLLRASQLTAHLPQVSYELLKFEKDPTGTYYISPLFMSDVPVGKINDHSTYWSRGWSKRREILQELNDKVRRESDALAAKDVELERLKTPKIKNERKKIHDRLVSFKKDLTNSAQVLDWANSLQVHPNQFCSKAHVTGTGMLAVRALGDFKNAYKKVGVQAKVMGVKLNTFDLLRGMFFAALQNVTQVEQSGKDEITLKNFFSELKKHESQWNAAIPKIGEFLVAQLQAEKLQRARALQPSPAPPSPIIDASDDSRSSEAPLDTAGTRRPYMQIRQSTTDEELSVTVESLSGSNNQDTVRPVRPDDSKADKNGPFRASEIGQMEKPAQSSMRNAQKQPIQNTERSSSFHFSASGQIKWSAQGPMGDVQKNGGHDDSKRSTISAKSTRDVKEGNSTRVGPSGNVQKLTTDPALNVPKMSNNHSIISTKTTLDIKGGNPSSVVPSTNVQKRATGLISNVPRISTNRSTVSTNRTVDVKRGNSSRIAPSDMAPKPVTGLKSSTTKKTSHDSILDRRTTLDAKGATSSRIASDGRIRKPATDSKASVPRNTDSGFPPYSRSSTPPHRSKNANLSSKSLGSQKSLKSVNDSDFSHKNKSSKTTLSKAEGPANTIQSAAPQNDVPDTTSTSQSQVQGYRRTYAEMNEPRISVSRPKGQPGEHLALLTRAVWAGHEYRDDKSPKMVGVRYHMKDSKFVPYFEAEDKWAKSLGWMLFSTKDITGVIYGYKRFVIVHDGKTLFLAFKEYDDAKALLEAINPSENKSIIYHEGDHHFDDVWPNHSLRSRMSFQKFHEEMLEMAKPRPHHAFSLYNV